MIARKPTVLITSAGMGSAMNVMKALRQAHGDGIRIAMSDADRTAAGLHLADQAFLSPPVKERASYENFLLETVAQLGPCALLPCYSGEIEVVAAMAPRLRDCGAGTCLPAPESVALCDDKERFAAFASARGIRTPRVYGDGEEPVYPVFAKPRRGSGSKGASRIDGPGQRSGDLVYQELIEGPEITVDVYCDPKTGAVLAGARERLEIRNGQSVKGRTVDSAPFQGTIEAVCKALGLRGASNFQFILGANGPVLIEVNPRFAAGGLMLTVAAGLNIPALVLQAILGPDLAAPAPRFKTGLMMARYSSEVVWEERP